MSSKTDATGNEVDVFQDDAPSIVDCDVLEAAKENIQPLASGRRVTALSAILKTPHAHRESKLAEARKRHRLNVEIALEDEDDDPLDAYSRFVHWTVENYPQGHSAESCLLELLEEATRVLKNDRGGIWKPELKYLKLWVLYASYVEKPSMIYKFCLANEIGGGHGLLYEEYANVLERMGKKNEADEIYLLGIARQAGPLERLKSRHAEFQKRMMTSSSSSVVDADATPVAPSRRPVLANTTSGPAPPVVASDSSTQPRPNARLQIFMDPDGTGAKAAELEESSSFPDLGTRKSRVKENVKEVTKAGGTTLKQAGKSKRIASASAAPKFVPYRDPEPEEEAEMPPPPVPASKSKEQVVPQTPSRRGFVPFRDADDGVVPPSTPKFTPYRDEPTTPSSPSGPVPDSVMKLKWAGEKGSAMTSEAEALRKDPFKNYEVDAKPLDSDD